jgi:hypothetical protein
MSSINENSKQQEIKYALGDVLYNAFQKIMGKEEPTPFKKLPLDRGPMKRRFAQLQPKQPPTQLNDREKEHLEKMFARVGMEFNR